MEKLREKLGSRKLWAAILAGVAALVARTQTAGNEQKALLPIEVCLVTQAEADHIGNCGDQTQIVECAADKHIRAKDDLTSDNGEYLILQMVQRIGPGDQNSNAGDQEKQPHPFWHRFPSLDERNSNT